MSHPTHPASLRPLAGAVLIAVAGLAAPAASHAQTSPEGALLNRLAPTVFIPSAFASSLGAAIGGPADAVDGERALLAQTPVIYQGNPEKSSPEATALSVNGAYALLGKSTSLDARRRTIPPHRGSRSSRGSGES